MKRKSKAQKQDDICQVCKLPKSIYYSDQPTICKKCADVKRIKEDKQDG